MASWSSTSSKRSSYDNFIIRNPATQQLAVHPLLRALYPLYWIANMKARVEDVLRSYGVSVTNGFLPEKAPLKTLPDTYYSPWESIVTILPTLIAECRVRAQIDALPVLDTSRLHSEPEWQRAYSILGFLTHAYIWGGDQPSEVCPPNEEISC